MPDPILTVNFYRTPSGHEPVREWLLEMSANDKRIIGEDIKTVQFGWPMGMPLVEKIGTNLWEIRSGGLTFGIARVFFTIEHHHIILLHGIVKKSQKIPKSELSLVQRRLNELLR